MKRLISFTLFVFYCLLGFSQDLCPRMDNKIEKTQYSVDYSIEDKIPVTVYYVIHQGNLGKWQRTSFYSDLDYCASPKLYQRSGYDKGHMLSSLSSEYPKESFNMINIIPQTASFNRGIWKRTENFERLNCSPMCYVICGVILDGGESKIANTITIPEVFYKILYNPEYESMIAFLLTQSDRGDLHGFIKTVDEVEELTGLDFFYQLDKDLQEKLEGTVEIGDWNW